MFISEKQPPPLSPSMRGIGGGANGQIKLILNGQDRVFAKDISILELLNELDIKPQGIAVELNLEIAPKSKFSETILKHGDKIEIVRMVGGG